MVLISVNFPRPKLTLWPHCKLSLGPNHLKKFKPKKFNKIGSQYNYFIGLKNHIEPQIPK